MNIRSETITVDHDVKVVSRFLGNYNNYQKLMPEQVIRWESDERSGRFTIKDLTELGLRIGEIRENEYILLHSDGKVPFDFSLKFCMTESNGKTRVHCEFEGKPSPMIAMMAKRPLTNLVNHMVNEIPANVKE